MTFYLIQNKISILISFKYYSSSRTSNPSTLIDPTARNSNVPGGNGAGIHSHSDSMITNRSLMHEHSRSLSSGANDLNRQNSPGRPPYPGDRNIGLSPHGIHPQRPTNLGLEASPRKHVLETKTDYGKYRFVLIYFFY